MSQPLNPNSDAEKQRRAVQREERGVHAAAAGKGNSATGNQAVDARLCGVNAALLTNAPSGGALGTGAPYRPGREIARGGMGAVLDTQDEKFQRAVAMKVMLKNSGEEGRRRFLQEARVLGQLAHPNIVPVHDLGVDAQGRLFYTMKLVKGVTLRAVLDALRAGDRETLAKFPLGQLLTMFQKVCDAMAFAHARGVIHRDLKPDNIMVGEFGEVMVMDWGLAKILPDSATSTALLVTGDDGANARSRRGNEADRAPVVGNPPPHSYDVTLAVTPHSRRGDEAERAVVVGNPPPYVGGYAGDVTLAPASGRSAMPDDVTLAPNAKPTPLSAADTGSATLEGSVMGTPHFMAPEQAEGRVNDLDVRTDVFALGGILYGLLTLEKPVTGDTVQQILANILSGRITPPARRQREGADGGAAVPLALPHCPGRRVPDALSAVAMKALQVDPARRYQSVAYLQADLAAYQNGFATSAEAAGVLKQLQLFILRHKIVASASLLALLLTVGFMAKVMASERRAVFNQQRAATKQAEAVASQKNTAATLVRLRDTAPTFHEQALARLEDQQLEPALEKVAYAIELMPAEPKFRLLQANLLQTLLRLDAAKAAYATVLQLDPTNAVARESLVLCDQLTFSTNGGGLAAKSLTNLLATLRRQQRLDEALYLTSGTGKDSGGGKELLQTWQARLAAAGLKTSKLSVQGDQKLVLHVSGLTDKDMSELKGMPLKKLTLTGGKAIRSLAPLAGMPLEELDITEVDMDSIEPLRGMRLGKLTIRDSRVSDLRPLAGMPLTNLVLLGCKNLEDLTPLKGLPLRHLNFDGSGVKDLNPLKGMQLIELRTDSRQTPFTTLAPLAGMPVQELRICVSQVLDLRPLAGLPVRRLILTGADHSTRDLSPLRACRQLEELEVHCMATDWNVLLDLPSLKTVKRYSGKPLPPAQFIAEQTRAAKK